MMNQDQKSKLILSLGVLLISTAPIFVKLIMLPPAQIGAYRCGIAGLMLLPVLFYYRNTILPTKDVRKYLFFVFLGGLMFALDLTVWHRSVLYVGASIATVLGNTQAVYLALFGVLFGKERLGWRLVASLLIGFLGIYLLVWTSGTPTPDYWLGIICGLATGIFYAGYIICLKEVELIHPKLSAVCKLGLVSLSTAIIILVISVVMGEHGTPTSRDWLWIIGMCIGPQILGWTFITRGLRHTSSATAGLMILFQPIGTTILSMLFLSETLTLIQVLGMALSLFAIGLGVTRPEQVATD